MKESRRYYEYLRRWGFLVLLGLVLGAVAGLGFYSQQVQKSRFKATASIIISANTRSGQFSIPVVSGTHHETGQAAVQEIQAIRPHLKAYEPISFSDWEIEQQAIVDWWTSVILGSVIGGLIIIAVVYVWDDAHAYLRHRQENAPPNI